MHEMAITQGIVAICEEHAAGRRVVSVTLEIGDITRQQADAVAAAERSLAMAKNQYAAGITTYLQVITAQNAALANESTAVNLLTRRMTASVNLIAALGGGWRESDVPSRDAVLARVATPAAVAPAPGPAAGPGTVRPD